MMFDIWAYLKLRFVYPKNPVLSKVRSLLPKHVETILAEGTVIESDVEIADSIEQIGPYVFIGSGTRVYNCKEIGAYSSISQDVKIGLRSHPKNWLSTSPVFYSKNRGFKPKLKFREFNEEPTIIGPDVLISSGCSVMSGVTIGQGSIIGAMSFVNKDIPPYAIVAGIPARIIGYRFDQKVIADLIKSNWINLSISQVSRIGQADDVEAFLKALENRDSK